MWKLKLKIVVVVVVIIVGYCIDISLCNRQAELDPQCWKLQLQDTVP